MYKLYSTIDHITFASNDFRSLWAANYIASDISFEGHAVDIVDMETGEIMASFTDHGTLSYRSPDFLSTVKEEALGALD